MQNIFLRRSALNNIDFVKIIYFKTPWEVYTLLNKYKQLFGYLSFIYIYIYIYIYVCMYVCIYPENIWKVASYFNILLETSFWPFS